MSTLQDNDWVLQLQQDDMTVIDTIYDTWYKTVYFNVLRLVKNKVATEDLTQDTFILLWKNRATLAPGTDIGHWLFLESYRRSVRHLSVQLRKALEYAEMDRIRAARKGKVYECSDAELAIAIEQIRAFQKENNPEGEKHP